MSIVVSAANGFMTHSMSAPISSSSWLGQTTSSRLPALPVTPLVAVSASNGDDILAKPVASKPVLLSPPTNSSNTGSGHSTPSATRLLDTSSPPTLRAKRTESVVTPPRLSSCSSNDESVDVLSTQLMRLQTSPKALAETVSVESFSTARPKRRRERSSVSTSTRRFSTSTTFSVPERQSSRTFGYSDGLGLAGMNADEVASVRESAVEIERTLSTSTTATDRSSNQSSGHETCATSAQSINSNNATALQDVPTDKLHIDTSCASPAEQETAASLSALKPPLAEAQRFSKLRRLHALHELVETERSYKEDLTLLVDVFFRHLGEQSFFEENPQRKANVERNATAILAMHREIADALDAILGEAGIGLDGRGLALASDIDAATSERAEEAVVRVARYFAGLGSRFSVYQEFCSRHAEALVMVREAERRHGGEDWRTYERHCSHVMRGMRRSTPRSTISRATSSGATTPSGAPWTPTSTFTALAPLTPAGSESLLVPSPSPSLLVTNSTPTTPSSSDAASLDMLREGASRLLFADYFVKPIQRLCLYPVVLNTLLKHSPVDEPAHAELHDAIATMRKVAEDVDQAGRERERVLMADLIASRIEPCLGVNASLVGSLGHCLLAGTMDVAHHHEILQPLSAPVRFKYNALFLYRGWLLVAKVRKTQMYEPKHWFPLWTARLSPSSYGNSTDDLAQGDQSPSGSASLAHALRITCNGGHHFELVASCSREKELWVEQLSLAIADAPLVPPLGCGPSFLTSLGDHSAASDDLRVTGTPDDASQTPIVDPLAAFFNAASPGVSTSSLDSLVRLTPPSQRHTLDKAVIMSDAVYAARSGSAYGNREDLDASPWHSGTPSIAAAMGAAMGFARAAARKTVSRRNSGILGEEDSLDSALPSSPEGGTWKSTLMRASRSRPSSLFITPVHAPAAATQQHILPSVAVTAKLAALGSTNAGTSSVPASPTFADRPTLTRAAVSRASIARMWSSTRGRSQSADADVASFQEGFMTEFGKLQSGGGGSAGTSPDTCVSPTELGGVEEMRANDVASRCSAGQSRTLLRSGSFRRAFTGQRRKRSDSVSSERASSSGNASPYPSGSQASSRESLTAGATSPTSGLATLFGTGGAAPLEGSLRRSRTSGAGSRTRAFNFLRTNSTGEMLPALPNGAAPSTAAVVETASSPHSPTGGLRDMQLPALRTEQDRTRRQSAPEFAAALLANNTNSKSSRRLSMRFLHSNSGARATAPVAPLLSVAETTAEHTPVSAAAVHTEGATTGSTQAKAPEASPKSPPRPGLARRPSTAEGIAQRFGATS